MKVKLAVGGSAVAVLAGVAVVGVRRAVRAEAAYRAGLLDRRERDELRWAEDRRVSEALEAEQLWGYAVHAAGHVVAGSRVGLGDPVVGGPFEPILFPGVKLPPYGPEWHDPVALLRLVTMGMAGQAAEELVLGAGRDTWCGTCAGWAGKGVAHLMSMPAAVGTPVEYSWRVAVLEATLLLDRATVESTARKILANENGVAREWAACPTMIGVEA